jgi:single-stranded DNA-binding protein
MSTFAKIFMVGYVGKDPVTPSPNNPNFVTFSLAVTTKGKDKNTNEVIKTTTWYECQTGIEYVASYIKQHIKKGMPLYLEGIPRCDAYIDKEGKPAASFKVSMSSRPEILAFANNKEDTVTPKAAVFHHDLNDDEIPF